MWNCYKCTSCGEIVGSKLGEPMICPGCDNVNCWVKITDSGYPACLGGGTVIPD